MSSLVFLAFTIIIFLVAYGLMWLLTPMILGMFFDAMGKMEIENPHWQNTYNQTEDVIRWIIPLIPTVGIFLIVIKVLMVATVRGRDA